MGALVSAEEADAFQRAGAVTAALGRQGDLDTAAARLYACLRELDASGVARIIAAAIPPDDRLGAALADRLTRAASGRIITVH